MSECNCGLTTGCPVCMPDNVTNKQQVKNGVTISVFASDVYDPKGLAWRERAKKAEAQLDKVREWMNDDSYGGWLNTDYPMAFDALQAILEQKL